MAATATEQEVDGASNVLNAFVHESVHLMLLDRFSKLLK